MLEGSEGSCVAGSCWWMAVIWAEEQENLQSQEPGVPWAARLVALWLLGTFGIISRAMGSWGKHAGHWWLHLRGCN